MDVLDQEDRVSLDVPGLGAVQRIGIDSLVDREFLEGAMSRLTQREKLVIQLRFGLDGAGEHSLREIGEEIGICAEGVRRVQDKALRRLRWHACRAFPERAKRAGISVLPGPVPQTREPDPARSKREPRGGKVRTPEVRGRPIIPEVRHAARLPAVLSGRLLLAVVGAYFIALGFNSTIAYQASALLGAVWAGIACYLVGMIGVMIILDQLLCLGDGTFKPDPAARKAALRCVLTTALTAVIGLLSPMQAFLQGLVSATPARFRNSTPVIVQLFSIVILLLCVAYLRGYWIRVRIVGSNRADINFNR